jgi:hypothetical protein
MVTKYVCNPYIALQFAIIYNYTDHEENPVLMGMKRTSSDGHEGTQF